MFTSFRLTSVLCIVLASCTPTNSGGGDIPNDDTIHSPVVLTDARWELRVDREWQEFSGNVELPSDQLTESAYQPVYPGPVYPVVFSDGCKDVSIGDTPIEGHLTTTGDERSNYDLADGTFAGGRFVVWSTSDGLRAEFTLYGSGRPIVMSERGDLVLVP